MNNKQLIASVIVSIFFILTTSNAFANNKVSLVASLDKDAALVSLPFPFPTPTDEPNIIANLITSTEIYKTDCSVIPMKLAFTKHSSRVWSVSAFSKLSSALPIPLPLASKVLRFTSQGNLRAKDHSMKIFGKNIRGTINLSQIKLQPGASSVSSLRVKSRCN